VLLQQILFSILLSSRCLSPASSSVSLSRAHWVLDSLFSSWPISLFRFSFSAASRAPDFCTACLSAGSGLYPCVVVRLVAVCRVQALYLFLLAKAPVELFVRAAHCTFFVLCKCWSLREFFCSVSSAPVRKNRQEQKLRLLLKSSLASSKVSILVWISVWIIVGRYRYSSWVTGSKHSKIRGLNCSSAVISRTRPPVVRWNAYDDIYCSLIWFLSSISHVFLLAPIRVSAAVPNPVLNVNRCSIAMWSWSC
jgi:hypothetical protein